MTNTELVLYHFRKALEEIAAYSDAGLNIGISNTCGKLNNIAKEVLDYEIKLAQNSELEHTGL